MNLFSCFFPDVFIMVKCVHHISKSAEVKIKAPLSVNVEPPPHFPSAVMCSMWLETFLQLGVNGDGCLLEIVFILRIFP